METSDLNVELYSSSLPRETWWGLDDYVYQINGFWFSSRLHEGVIRTIKHFNPLPTDIILASFPKTGTTWLKSLLYCIVNSSSKQSLIETHPHELVPSLEINLYGSSTVPLTATTTNLLPRRIFNTHIPYQLFSKTLDSSDCRVVYITRNPKDTLISTWHFINKWKKAEQQPWPLEVAIDRFCSGIIPSGPYYDHVLDYWKESLERPKKVLFITYEDLKNDPNTHVKKLAEFLGCPFEGENEVEEVVRNCSFEIISKHEVNKSKDFSIWHEIPYDSFFRRGEVGDYKNSLNAQIIQRIDDITKEKFHGSGFMYGI